MPSKITEKKDPDAVLWYAIDWSTWLGEATITGSTWEVPTGLTQVGAAAFTATEAKIKLSGGTAGQRYNVRNRITTSGGETNDHTLVITCAEQ
jgi:hypothetical protein